MCSSSRSSSRRGACGRRTSGDDPRPSLRAGARRGPRLVALEGVALPAPARAAPRPSNPSGRARAHLRFPARATARRCRPEKVRRSHLGPRAGRAARPRRPPRSLENRHLERVQTSARCGAPVTVAAPTSVRASATCRERYTLYTRAMPPKGVGRAQRRGPAAHADEVAQEEAPARPEEPEAGRPQARLPAGLPAGVGTEQGDAPGDPGQDDGVQVARAGGARGRRQADAPGARRQGARAAHGVRRDRPARPVARRGAASGPAARLASEARAHGQGRRPHRRGVTRRPRGR